jgi:2-amino-5-formylamino-6-ribosylaminopyrimidin-4(3H)-one 5'-monophosphate deformylase
LKKAKNNLNLEAVVLVNGHGGNVPIKDYISDIEKKSGVKVVFNNKIVEIEGPMQVQEDFQWGQLWESLMNHVLDEHCEFDNYPEWEWSVFRKHERPIKV